MFEGRSGLAAIGAAVAAFVGFNAVAERNAEGEITSAGVVSAFEMRVGDCFDDEAFEASEISDVPGMPCADPHDNEVYATFDIQGDWPGDEGVEEAAFGGCYDRFAGAIGRSYEESVLDYTAIYPSLGSWKQRGDREVTCVAYNMNFDKLEGSVIGSGL